MPLAFPAPLAPYASRAEETRGRLHAEPESETRTPFQRDRDRVVHSVAFRRLKHKTQVFVSHDGDHYRTRLTHSLEVAQIARSLARLLKLDEDLAETLALAHDLGHSPFGHTGEDALQECMEPYGGFDHNAQTLRILTKLERRHAAFDGLNLTWETLEGVVKHNGPVAKPYPAALSEYAAQHDLELGTFASLEAQIAAVSDDIAYNNHDVDDGLRAGVFSLKDVEDVPIIGEAMRRAKARWPEVDEDRLIAEAVSDLIGAMVADVRSETERRLAEVKPESAAAVRAGAAQIVDFSEEMKRDVDALRAFLKERMYRHWKVNRERSKARRIVRDLFGLFLAEPETLPAVWRERYEGRGEDKLARAVCDYIAGMTDRYAAREHAELFGPNPA
ncbi:MAG: deoxyguanosinetriphosphate triphosphohydrolase [Pseudomonadota bacterium]